ncbi:MAG: hypothetical protein AAF518_01765 [Spirochaetota bacterium]
MFKSKALPVYLFCILFSLACNKKKTISQDIQECDPVGNYYEDGNHYISRDIVTDDGVLNYKKMFNNYYKREGSPCDPESNLETK